jgi:hypothetical protein
MRRAGYDKVENPDDARGRWRVSADEKLLVYARIDLDLTERRSATRKLLIALQKELANGNYEDQ